jgi:hypothetical protein
MSRLITFGCSYTFGHGLPDCLDQEVDGCRIPPETASNLGWPVILANKMNRTLINVSRPGSSNLEILYSILSFDFQSTDQIVVMWSHNIRDIIFTEDDMNPLLRLRLGPWSNERYAQQWVLKVTERDYCLKTWIYIQHSDLFFEKKNIKWLHYPAAPHELLEFKFNFINSDHICFDGFKIVDDAEDNKHPGLKTQQLIADKIYNQLYEQSK